MIAPPDDDDIDALSDWAETCAYAAESGMISKGDIETLLDSRGREDSEALTSDIWSEIDRRSQLSAGAVDAFSLSESPYPVDLTATRIQWNARPSSRCYAFQLLLSMQGHCSGRGRLSEADWNRAAATFERLTAVALQGYFGGTVLRIGSPRDDPLPHDFWACVDFLIDSTRERKSDGDRTNPRVQDKEIDVFAWRPFGDGRPGQIIVVAQCAAGKNWTEKGRIPLEVWRDYIAWIHPPVAALAIPFVHHDGLRGAGTWRESSLNHTAILLDRLRITTSCMLTSARAAIEAELAAWDEPLRATLRTTQ